MPPVFLCVCVCVCVCVRACVTPGVVLVILFFYCANRFPRKQEVNFQELPTMPNEIIWRRDSYVSEGSLDSALYYTPPGSGSQKLQPSPIDGTISFFMKQRSAVCENSWPACSMHEERKSGTVEWVAEKRQHSVFISPLFLPGRS